MAEYPASGAFLSLLPSFRASRKMDLKHKDDGFNAMIVASFIVIVLTGS